MKNTIRYVGLYTRFIASWLAIAAVIGICCGLIGGGFYLGVEYATELRTVYPQLIYFLPLAGLLIVFIYEKSGLTGTGTDAIIDAARDGSALRLRLVPAIFIATILTHLTGGSSGREGAALQLGGSISNYIGKRFKLDQQTMKIITMMGMAAFFSALFGTPLTATIFVVTFVNVGHVYSAAIFPSLAAAMIAYGVARWMGMEPFHYFMGYTPVNLTLVLKVVILAALCGLVSTLFVRTLHFTSDLYKKYLKNPYIRVFVGGVLIILLTTLVGNYDYNGAGGHVITRAIEAGEAVPYAFLLKILFTAVTLEAGYKGGEIVPTFFIGATFGCFAGGLLGMSPGFGAAIGLIAMFCGATNSVLASAILAAEAFSGVNILYFGIACVVSFVTSAYDSLYASQIIVFSKIRQQQVDLRPSGKARVNRERILEKLEEARKEAAMKKMTEEQEQKGESDHVHS